MNEDDEGDFDLGFGDFAVGMGGDAVGEEGDAVVSGGECYGKTLMEWAFAKKVKLFSVWGVTKTEKN